MLAFSQSLCFHSRMPLVKNACTLVDIEKLLGGMPEGVLFAPSYATYDECFAPNGLNFVHIPKTGGHSFYDPIEALFFTEAYRSMMSSRFSYLILPRILSHAQSRLLFEQFDSQNMRPSLLVSAVHNIDVNYFEISKRLQELTGIPILNFGFHREPVSRFESHVRYMVRYGQSLQQIENDLSSRSSDVNNCIFRWCHGLQGADRNDQAVYAQLNQPVINALLPHGSASICMLLSHIISSVGAPNILVFGKLNNTSALLDYQAEGVNDLICKAKSMGFFDYEDHINIHSLLDSGSRIAKSLLEKQARNGHHYISRYILALCPDAKAPQQLHHAILDFKQLGLNGLLELICNTARHLLVEP